MIERFPKTDAIRLGGIEAVRESGAAHLAALGIAGPVMGISPGAAYGNAKRWLPERFAEVARRLQAVSPYAVGLRLLIRIAALRTGDHELRGSGMETRNLAGETTLREFIDLASACRLSSPTTPSYACITLAVSTVAVFGATDDTTTGPTDRAGSRGPGTCRLQSLPAPRMPHRSPLHDACHRRPRGRRRSGTLGGIRTRVDPRSKILTTTEALGT